MAQGIQFRNAEQLLAGFRNTGAEGWSVWEGKQFLTKGIGEDTLSTFIDMLAEGSTNTPYILRVYEDIHDAKQIKEKTDADGSFKFVLSGDPDNITSELYSRGNNSNRLFGRIASMEKELKELKEEQPAEEFDMSIGGLAKHFIQNPTELLELVSGLRSIFSPGYQPPQITRTIGNVQPAQENVPPPAQQQSQQSFEERIAIVQNSVTRLDRNDSNFVEHIKKLADLSDNNPTQFKFLTSLLDKM